MSPEHQLCGGDEVMSPEHQLYEDGCASDEIRGALTDITSSHHLVTAWRSRAHACPACGLIVATSTPNNRPAACQRSSNGVSKRMRSSHGTVSHAF